MPAGSSATALGLGATTATQQSVTVKHKSKDGRRRVAKYPQDAHIQPFANRIETDPYPDEMYMLKYHKRLRCTLTKKQRSWKHYRKTQYREVTYV